MRPTKVMQLGFQGDVCMKKTPSEFCYGNSHWIQESTSPIVILSENLHISYESSMHCHLRGQVVYAVSGKLAVNVGGNRWILAPTRAAWIPPNINHSIECLTKTSICTLYVAIAQCEELPAESCLMSISPLFREMALRISILPDKFESDSPKARLISSLIDELRSLPLQLLRLPMPKDRRLLRLCERLSRKPNNGATIPVLANEVALSPRHLMRLFQIETGMQFGAWRQQMRLMVSLHYLASGTSVLRTSEHVGYKSVAAFTTSFKRAFGITPSKYVNERT